MAKGIRKSIWATFFMLLFVGILPLNFVNAAVMDPSGSGSGAVLEVEDRYVAGEVLVKLSPSTASVRAVQKSKQGLAIESLRGYGEHSVQPLGRIKPKESASKARSVLKEPAINRWYLVKLPPDMSVDEALAILKQDSDVEVAEPNYEVSIAATPNDPRYPELWNMHNIAQTGGTPDADIDGPEAWDIATGNGDVIIGVIDTGVDYTHEDLKDNMWTNPGEIPDNGIDDDGNGYVDDVHGYDFVNDDGDPMDDHGHGTHVAGTIAGVGDNNIGVVGVNWNAKIAGIKFLSASGGGSTAGAINSIIYANNNGIRITNNSWGGGLFSQALLDAINAGGLFVAAAGNDRSNTDNVSFYPAAYISDNIISVAATDHNDALASFSNYGLTSVDLAAPGVRILSTVPYSSCPLCNASGYRWLNGTSMAAPHVAGAAALMQSVIPQSTTAQLKTWIMDSVDPVAALNGRMVTGGRLNINTLLSNSDYGLTLDPGTVSLRAGQSATATLTIIALETFNGPLSLQVDNSNPALTVTLSKTTVDIQPGDMDTVTVTVSADASLLADSYTYRLIATDAANVEKNIEVAVDVSGADYEILVTPASVTVNGSQSAAYTVVLESIEQFIGPVTLSFNTGDATIVGTFSENPVTLSADTITTVDLSVSTTISTPREMHELQISASDGVRNKTTSAQLNVVQKPDLTVSALTGTSLIGLQGLLSMNFTIANQGPVNASGRIYYQIVLSDDAVISSEDTVLRSTYFRNLTANSSRNIVYSTVLPAAIAQGNYYLGVIVDFTGQHAESDENNNTRAQPVQVVNSVQDAMITSLTSSSTTIRKGMGVVLSGTLKNGGTNAMNGLVANYYFSTDNVITADDYLIGSNSTDLGPGRSVTQIVNSAALYLDSGDYYFGIIVDPDNIFTETDEGNNVVVSSTVITISDNRDLTVSALTGTSLIGLQGLLSMNFTIANQGPVNTSGRIYYQIVLSDDAVISSEDTVLRSTYFRNLTANSSRNIVYSTVLPAAIAQGNYYLGVIVDFTGQHDESDENNNTRSLALTVQ
ncbi:MAG: S8 family serine peptidase [Gammaproteobacteria bacterium]|nr:S8 family serine peptidase [Gammaproteobacteria bacterium]MCF6259384.1 S8 family serine peptidase [Gammaproteobacteria bacterium]